MEITEDGNFILTNCGRRPIYVDGRPVLTDRSMILSDNQLVEVSYEQPVSHVMVSLLTDLLFVISCVTQSLTGC